MDLSLAWRQSRAADDGGPPSGGAARQALRMLLALRIFTPVAQIATLLVAMLFYQVHVALAPIVVLLVIEGIVAAATAVRLRHWRGVSQAELFAQALLDATLFAAVLYFTGGTANPFAPLFLVPIVIVSSALDRLRVWLLALATIAAYFFLRQHHMPLWHPEGHTQVYELHEDGMVVNYVLTAALLAFFCNYMHAALRSQERRLIAAREAQMRNESVVSLGALAAGYAHELSSPLSAMAVVVGELKIHQVGDARVVQELEVVERQIDACKHIISRLTSAGGQRRAESAGGARLDQFLGAAVDWVRALHPGATIHASIEGPAPAPLIVAEETLRQAIMNLVQNAAQASPEHVQVTATWDLAELVVDVRDRGPGFPAEILRSLGRKVGSTKGTMGMGLLLSATTLERMGGALELSNPDSGGALATIRMPLASIVLNPGKGFDHAGTKA
jgi:two-component system sensor histidine kinase RegB